MTPISPSIHLHSLCRQNPGECNTICYIQQGAARRVAPGMRGGSGVVRVSGMAGAARAAACRTGMGGRA